MNSAASRAYYAMFQAAHVALEAAGVARAQWSHPALQAAFTSELVNRRKAYPAALRDHLSIGLGVRQAADYGRTGVSQKSGASHGSTRCGLRFEHPGGHQAWTHELARTTVAGFSMQS